MGPTLPINLEDLLAYRGVENESSRLKSLFCRQCVAPLQKSEEKRSLRE